MEDLFYDLLISEKNKTLYNELHDIMKWYDYKYNVSFLSNPCYDMNVIIRKKASGEVQYKNLEDFILNGIFYKTKKNLHYFPQKNREDSVANFELNQFDIIGSNPVLKHLLDHNVFAKFIKIITNYGVFIRFAENKVQRLYWNLPFNAGLPLTAKEKDLVYELIFLLHDLGHFLLPDLVFTGNTSELHKKIYVIWRLLGESITVTLNEMIIPNYIKDFEEFKQNLKLDFDKPYKLFEKFTKPDNYITDKNYLYDLFYGSFQYFCAGNSSGLISLLKTEDKESEEWKEFDKRYRPVAERGKEWTQMNYDNMKSLIGTDNYKNWFIFCEQFTDELGLQTIDSIIEKLNISNDSSDEKIMKLLFDRIFITLLEPLFISSESVNLIKEEKRSSKAFKRYFIGNLLLLVCHDIDISELVTELYDNVITKQKMDYLIKMYQKHVETLYKIGKISLNEFHNYKNIFTMIPPNIIKKDSY